MFQFNLISCLINGLTSLFLLVFIYSKNPLEIINKRYAIFGFSVTTWAFAYFFWHFSKNEAQALVFIRVLLIGAMFIPATFVHFIFEFLKIAKKGKIFIFLCYSISIVFIFAVFSDYIIKSVDKKLAFNYWPTAGILFIPFLLYFLITFLVTEYILYFQHNKAKFLKENTKSNQIRYIFVGTLIGILGGSTNFFLYFNIMLPPLGNILVSAYIIGVAYAIFTARLMDIEVVIEKGFAFIGSFIASIVLGYFSFYMLYKSFNLGFVINYCLSSLAGFGLFLFLLWLINENILKPEKSQFEALKDSTYNMVIIPDPIKMINEVVMQVDDTFHPLFADIYLIATDTGGYVFRASKGQSTQKPDYILSKENPVVKWFFDLRPEFLKKSLLEEARSNVITREEIDHWLELPKETNQIDMLTGGLLSEIKEEIGLFNASVVVGALYHKRMYGVLILGEKKKGFYRSEELELLSRLATVVAMNVRNVLNLTGLHKKVVEKNALLVEKDVLLEELEKAYNEAVEMLNNIVALKDEYTGSHLKDSEELAEEVADNLEKRLDIKLDRWALKKGSRLHDIGKAKIDSNIIQKPGSLTNSESAQMRKHPIFGKGIVIISPRFRNVAIIIEQHHEQPDGKGYPHGLKIGEIKIESMVVSAVDSYLAMTSERPYNKGRVKTPIAACKELVECAGKQFDYQVVFSFIEVISQIENSISEIKGGLIDAIERKINDAGEYMAIFNKMIGPLKLSKRKNTKGS